MLRLADIQTLANGGGYAAIVRISQTTGALILSLLTELNTERIFGYDLTDSELDDARFMRALAIGELMSNLFLGVVVAVPTDILPDGMLWCDGATYDKASYPALSDYLGADYSVSATQFAVPDYRNAMLRDVPSRAPNTRGGSDALTLTVDQMPPHTHGYTTPTFNVDIESVGIPDPTGVGLPQVPATTGSTGGGNSIDVTNRNVQARWAIVAG